MRAASFAIFLCVLGTFPDFAHAQSTAQLERGGLDLRLFRPAIDSKGHFTVNGSDILGANDFAFGLVLDLGVRAGRFNGFVDDSTVLAADAERTRYLIDQQVAGTLFFDFGIANWAVIGVQLPLTFVRGPAVEIDDYYNTGANVAGLQAQGIGDISLVGKLRLLRVEQSPIGLAATLRASFPTGNQRRFTGDAGVTLWPTLVAEVRPHQRFRMSLELGYRALLGNGSSAFPLGGRTCPASTSILMGTDCTAGGVGPTNATDAQLVDDGDPLDYDDLLTFGFGMSFRAIHSLDIVAEIYGSQIATEFGSQGALSLEALGGLKIFVHENSYLVAGAGGGLPTDGIQASRIRATLGFVFEPSIADSDGDGLRDDVDECPNDPEDFDEFEDDDGCPELDNDRDGIPDTADECPLVPEDRDGIEDDDGCPEGGEGDRDHDGIPDDQDQCPDNPEDRDDFEDTDGCPEPDNDRDGIPDVHDLCPNDPEDRDGFQDEDGCPDPDNDSDRILDPNDQCPDEPETYNGTQDQDGCPDRGMAIIEGDQIIILDKIYFETNSAVIQSRSFTVLDAVAATLSGNPQLGRVEVQGHADERGNDNHNLELTRDRAAAVLEALVQRGVERARLRSTGYGELCPINSGHNAAAWEANRRVEFHILADGQEPPSEGNLTCPANAQPH